MAAQDDLLKQILDQGLTSKWSGGFGSQDAAKDMARILDSIGISDIKQFGKVPTYKPVEIGGYKYNGQPIQQYRDEEGIERSYIKEPTGETTYNWETNENIPTMRTVGVPSDAKLEPIYGTKEIIGYGDYGEAKTFFTPVKDSDVITKDGQTVAKVGETFGNKVTGQEVPITYSERQTGNAFGGTFQGSGNTGYRVEFTPDGTPIFYTTGASSSDIGDIAPLLTMASFIPGLQPFAMAANAAIAADQGDVLGALAGAAGLGGFSEVANAARMGKALQSGDPLAILMSGANVGGVTDVGGVNLGDVSKGIGAVKAIQSGDPLAMLRYGMGALPKSDGLTSNLGPGTPEEFSEGLIPGYFQPGGEGYIAPTEETPTGPGVYDEITGKFIPGEGPLQGPLGPETGNIDPNKEWEYSLTKPGVWTSKDGEEIDLSYMPDRDTAMTGAELMERAGAMPGGVKSPAAKAPTGAPAKTSGVGGKLGNAIAGVAGALGAGSSGATGTAPTTTAVPNAPQQTSNADLLNLLSSKPELANIKSFKELFGEGLFGDTYVPPSALNADDGFSGMPIQMPDMGQSAGDDGFSNGGRVDNFDVDALLQILRG